MRVLWSFFIVIIAIHGSLTQVVVPKKPAFLIALPYALDDTTGDFEFDVFSSLRLLVYGMHLSSNLAVKDVMVEYDIPKDAIEFVYINTWNPEFGSPDTYFLSDSGAYTATAIYEVIQQYNVIGIFGDIFSRTTRFSAGLASYFQKPFCGATQGSITLSEKINYPYFYRMVTARGGGKHYLSVLKFYGMKTLCIFRTSDDLSRSVAEEVKQEAIKQGVNVVSITFGDELFQTNDFKHQFRLAKRQNCKFIFASMSWVSLSILYDAGITYGLVGPDNLWSSYNIARPLDSANTTIIKEYWGFLQIIDASPIGTQWRNFSQRFYANAKTVTDTTTLFPEMNLTRIEEAREQIYFGNAREVYSCIQVMFRGFHQFLEERGEKGRWDRLIDYRSDLNHSAFARTGYVDVTGDNIALNEYGDLDASRMALTTNSTNVLDIHRIGSTSFAFGSTSNNGDSFVEFFKPTFYGESLFPPVDDDGTMVVDSVAEGSPLGIAIRSSQALGLLSIFVMLGIAGLRTFRTETENTPAIWAWLVITGGLLVIVSTFWSVGANRIQLCFVPCLFFVQGVSIFIGCGWYVMFRRMWLYNNLAKLARPMRGESLGKVVLGAMVANFFLVLLYRFSRPLGNDIRVCGPLKVADQWDFKIAMGIINIIAVSVVLTLLIFFKHRRSSPTFDNIFKIASVCLISVICFELVLKPSKLQTALEAIILNVLPVFACVLLVIQKPEIVSPENYERKKLALHCHEFAHPIRVQTRGRFGWREEEKYFVNLWVRGAIPWMTISNVDGESTHRVDLKRLRLRDVYTEKDIEATEIVVDKGVSKNAILLVLPDICLILRMRSTEMMGHMVDLLKGFANLNEESASHQSDVFGRGSQKAWKSELSGFG